jgi:hypothetical protein
VPYVKSDYYDTFAFINKLFEKAKETSFDSFSASSTLQNVIDNSIYGDCINANEREYAYCNQTQRLTDEIYINQITFLFAGPIYDYAYDDYYNSSKQYNFNVKVDAIKYQIGLSGEAYGKTSAIINALKTEIEKRYNCQFKEENDKYIAYKEDKKIGFKIEYSNYCIFSVIFAIDKVVK